MRLWSIHPEYLDAKGLVALWREALLAKKVLQNKTKGYKHHPQLIRFKEQKYPLSCINYYLQVVHSESKKRNFNFNITKIGSINSSFSISVTTGQIEHEFTHLLNKLKKRDKLKYDLLKKNNKKIKTHPLFYKRPGEIEAWERI